MNFRDLNSKQLAHVAAEVKRQRDYFGKLKERMRALAFDKDDQMLVETNKAFDAVGSLLITMLTEVNRREKNPAVESEMMKRWANR